MYDVRKIKLCICDIIEAMREVEKKLKKDILKIIGKYLDLKKYKVFFFSSRVTGTADERADIDVAIEGPKAVPLEIILAIKEEIDNLPTLYKIDIVDFKSVSKDFYRVAKQKIEIINK
ncbi:MAG: hypothetical protein KatS3mg027_2695 [Bacteroidia bacterium]|nr:MAG: hypothetical protein KatS3mg027_2695 [Bacteroidia bacterium]